MHGDNCSKFFRWLCKLPFRLATCANYSQLVSKSGNRSCALCHSLSRALREQITWGRLNSSRTMVAMQHYRL